MTTKGGPGGKKDHVRTSQEVQNRQRNTLVAVLGIIVLVFAGLVWADQAGIFAEPGGDLCEGVTGAPSSPIHEHARLFVYLNDSQPWDFSERRYQVAHQTLHFENGAQDAQGATMHIHLDRSSQRPDLACFFSTLGWRASEDQIRTDTGEVFRVDATHNLTITYNGEEAPEGLGVVLRGCEGACNTYVVKYEYTGPPGQPAPPPPDEGNATTSRDE